MKKRKGKSGDISAYDPADYSLTLEEYYRREDEDVRIIEPRPRKYS